MDWAYNKFYLVQVLCRVTLATRDVGVCVKVVRILGVGTKFDDVFRAMGSLDVRARSGRCSLFD